MEAASCCGGDSCKLVDSCKGEKFGNPLWIPCSSCTLDVTAIPSVCMYWQAALELHQFVPVLVGADCWRCAAPCSASLLHHLLPPPWHPAPITATVSSALLITPAHSSRPVQGCPPRRNQPPTNLAPVRHELVINTARLGLLQEGRVEICGSLEAERDLGTLFICSCAGAGLSSLRPQAHQLLSRSSIYRRWSRIWWNPTPLWSIISRPYPLFRV